MFEEKSYDTRPVKEGQFPVETIVTVACDLTQTAGESGAMNTSDKALL